MFALAYYDGRTAAAEVPIQSIPVWVVVFGLPPILTTKETLYMVCATLGKSVHHDNPNLLSGARAMVRIEHDLDSLVKQV
ncbi:hypothetical protein ACLB2K_076431 [Fragaria x ananassa]